MADNWQKFEEMGEETVRKAIADNVFGADRKKAAYEWLDFKKQVSLQDAEERKDLSNREQIEIARSAKNAAWAAAIAAIIAAICAVIAVFSS